VTFAVKKTTSNCFGEPLISQLASIRPKPGNEFVYHDHGLHPWLLPDTPSALLICLTRYIEEKIQMKILQESFAVKSIPHLLT
jgi:hypothetical protein